MALNLSAGGTNRIAWGYADFDGDGLADPAEFAPSNGLWRVCLSSAGYRTAAFTLGGNTCLPAAADYDGDAKADPAVFDRSGGLLTAKLSASQYAPVSVLFADSGAAPVVADFDGDARADPALYNPAFGLWTVLLSSAGYLPVALVFGGAGAGEAAADYDGDGLTDPGVFDASAMTLTVKLSASGYAEIKVQMNSTVSQGLDRSVETLASAGQAYDPSALSEAEGPRRTKTISARQSLALPDIQMLREGDACYSAKSAKAAFATKHELRSRLWLQQKVALEEGNVAGNTNICAVCADYDGDSKADPMIYRESTGAWYGLLSGSGYVPTAFTYGAGLPAAPGDYNGDGQADPAAYQESPAGIGVYFPEGANTPGTFQQTNVLHIATTVSDAVKAGDDAIAVIYGKDQAEYGYSCMWWETISHAGGLVAEGPVLYKSAPVYGEAASSLVMDADLKPHIFTGYYGTGIEHLYQSGSDWTNEPISALEDVASSVMARVDANGYFHVVSAEWTEENSETVSVRYYSNRSGAWQNEEVLVYAGTSRWLWARDFALDAAGNAHVILSFQYHPSQDVTWPGTLYYLSNAGGTWSGETAAYKTHGSWDSFFPRFSLAVDPQGRPAVAAWLKYNVMTGSDALSQLVFYRRAGASSWSEQILADTADNYFGTDGGHFTGLYPKLAFDTSGDAHIIFSDLASSHIGGYESASCGQLRYAHSASGAWSFATLYRQSAAAGDGIRERYFMLSADGKGMDVVARVYPNDDSIVHFSSHRRSVFYFE